MSGDYFKEYQEYFGKLTRQKNPIVKEGGEYYLPAKYFHGVEPHEYEYLLRIVNQATEYAGGQWTYDETRKVFVIPPSFIADDDALDKLEDVIPNPETLRMWIRDKREQDFLFAEKHPRKHNAESLEDWCAILTKKTGVDWHIQGDGKNGLAILCSEPVYSAEVWKERLNRLLQTRFFEEQNGCLQVLISVSIEEGMLQRKAEIMRRLDIIDESILHAQNDRLRIDESRGEGWRKIKSELEYVTGEKWSYHPKHKMLGMDPIPEDALGVVTRLSKDMPNAIFSLTEEGKIYMSTKDFDKLEHVQEILSNLEKARLYSMPKKERE